MTGKPTADGIAAAHDIDAPPEVAPHSTPARSFAVRIHGASHADEREPQCELRKPGRDGQV